MTTASVLPSIAYGPSVLGASPHEITCFASAQAKNVAEPDMVANRGCNMQRGLCHSQGAVACKVQHAAHTLQTDHGGILLKESGGGCTACASRICCMSWPKWCSSASAVSGRAHLVNEMTWPALVPIHIKCCICKRLYGLLLRSLLPGFKSCPSGTSVGLPLLVPLLQALAPSRPYIPIAKTVKSTSPVTENHNKNGYVNYKNFIMTNEDNNRDTKYNINNDTNNHNAHDLHK